MLRITEDRIENFTFSLEQLLAWNLDVLLVSSWDDVKEVYGDRGCFYNQSSKVAQGLCSPSGRPHMVKQDGRTASHCALGGENLYPEQFKNLNLLKEMESFYGRFFHYRMSDLEAQEILRQKILNKLTMIQKGD